MKGLLYKEFLIVRGKNILLGIGIALAAFLMLRIAFPGADAVAAEGTEAASLPVGYMFDAMFMGFGGVIMMLGIIMLTPLVKMLTGNGRKRKERTYTMALPLPEDSAVKAKYITFFGWVVIMLGSAAAVLGLYFINAGKNHATDQVIVFLKIMPVLFAFIMAVGSIEMFAYLGLGKRRGDALLILLLVPIALVLVWCLFFVDLDALSKLDVGAVLKFYRNHKTFVRILSAVLIACAVGLYYVSFRIVRRMELNRKAEFDD